MKLSSLMALMCVVLTIFSSCEKESLEEMTPHNEMTMEVSATTAKVLGKMMDDEEDWEDEGWEEEICFDLVYPIQFSMADGTTATVNSEAELEALFENMDETAEPELLFPFDIVFEDGEVVTIVDEERAEEAIWRCFEDGDWEDEEGDCPDDEEWEEEICFDFVYPIQLVGEDGTTIDINTEEDWDAVFEDLENAEQEFDIVYPFDIIYEDGTTGTIADEEALDEAFYTCYEREEDEDDEDEDDEGEGEGASDTTGGRLAQGGKTWINILPRQ